MLHLGAVERSADFYEQGLAHFPFNAVKSKLDQFVGLEAAVDLRQHGRRQPVLADRDDGLQVVRGGPQGAALDGVQRGGIFSHDGILA